MSYVTRIIVDCSCCQVSDQEIDLHRRGSMVFFNIRIMQRASQTTETFIGYTMCYALRVLVSICFAVNCLGHIKLVIYVSSLSVCVTCVLACCNLFFLAGEINFEIFLQAG